MKKAIVIASLLLAAAVCHAAGQKSAAATNAVPESAFAATNAVPTKKGASAQQRPHVWAARQPLGNAALGVLFA